MPLGQSASRRFGPPALDLSAAALYAILAWPVFCKRPMPIKSTRTSSRWSSASSNCRPRSDQRRPPDSRWQRMRKTLQDNLQTSRDRLANLTKAKENYQLIQLEIERLENKIRSLERNRRESAGARFHQQRSRSCRLEHDGHRKNDERSSIRHGLGFARRPNARTSASR